MISAVLIDGAFSDEIFSEARIRDPRVHALADKVSVKEDPDFTKRFPAELPCRIDVRTRSGELKSASASFHRGHPRNPMTDDEVGSKFKALGGRFLPEAQLESGLQLLWKIDEVQDVGRVLDAFSRA
jgi:2-methylcitrate dehydratase